MGESNAGLFSRDMDHLRTILQRWVPGTESFKNNMGDYDTDPETFIKKIKIYFRYAVKFVFDPLLSKQVPEGDAGRESEYNCIDFFEIVQIVMNSLNQHQNDKLFH